MMVFPITGCCDRIVSTADRLAPFQATARREKDLIVD